MDTLKKKLHCNYRLLFFHCIYCEKTPTIQSNFQGLSCIGGDLYSTAGILVSPKYLFSCNKTYLIQTHAWFNGNLRLEDTIWVIKTSSLDQLLT